MSVNVGNKKLQKCGFVAEVVELLDNNRCVVRFENGVVKEVCCSSFISKSISAKDYKVSVGDKIKQGNGHVCEVIAVRSNNRIDVRFDNGVIREDVNKASFKSGKLGVNINSKLTVGTRVLQKCGSYAEVIELLDDSRCTIRFDSGTIKENVLRKSFKRGEVGECSYNKKCGKYVGMRSTASNGIGLEIVEYHSFYDIVVKSDDGKISKTGVVAFTRGQNNLTKKGSCGCFCNCLGITRVGLSGVRYTCIEYNGYNSIVLKSENGDIITTYSKRFLSNKFGDKFNDDFKRYGNKKNKTSNNKEIVNNDKNDLIPSKGSVIGRRVLQKCGEYAEAVSRNEDGTLNIKFDTGELRSHISRSSFYNGFVAKHGRLEPIEDGVTRLGMKYTFVGNVVKGNKTFRSVRFEDGEVAISYRKVFMHPKLLSVSGYFYLKSDSSSRVLFVYFDKIKCKYIALVKNKSGERRMVVL